jgi:hypothetical protein
MVIFSYLEKSPGTRILSPARIMHSTDIMIFINDKLLYSNFFKYKHSFALSDD